MCIILQLTYYILFTFPLQFNKLQQSPVPFWFTLPDVVIGTDAAPSHWVINVHILGYLWPLMETG